MSRSAQREGTPINAVARLVVVRGRVQGVGYRDAAIQVAFEHDVTGWVRNRADGVVELFVQGTPASVESFVAWCGRGPPLARVTEVVADDTEPDPALRAFEFQRTV